MMHYLNSNSLPSIDLHGNTRDIARVLINEFIEESYKMRYQYIRIIHGIGKGILKDTVKQTLKVNKHVIKYKINSFNVGETIVELNLK